MSDSADNSKATPVGHALLLGLFTALFALRVAAQLVQYASPSRFLPPFDAWQGSGLAYPVLLASQRLSTIFVADRAVVLQGGCIVEDGRPAELLAGDGPFAALFGDEARAAA